MSDSKNHERTDNAEGASAGSLWSRLLSWPNVAILVVVAASLHAATFWALLSRNTTTQAPAHAEVHTPELTLGSFRASAPDEENKTTTDVAFNLHVALLAAQDARARELFTQHRFKVQQGIEELLRQSRAEDFDDPLLNRVKLQIQEVINRALGVRVIDEVLITDLNAPALVYSPTQNAHEHGANEQGAEGHSDAEHTPATPAGNASPATHPAHPATAALGHAR